MLKETINKMTRNQKIAASMLGILVLYCGYQYVYVPLSGKIKNAQIIEERTKGL